MLRGCWSTVASDRQVVHIVAHLAGRQVVERLLEVLYISPGIAYLGVYSGIDSWVVGRLPHLVGSMDDGLFAIDLLADLVHGRVVVHGGGVAVLCGRAAAWDVLG